MPTVCFCWAVDDERDEAVEENAEAGVWNKRRLAVTKAASADSMEGMVACVCNWLGGVNAVCRLRCVVVLTLLRCCVWPSPRRALRGLAALLRRIPSLLAWPPSFLATYGAILRTSRVDCRIENEL